MQIAPIQTSTSNKTPQKAFGVSLVVKIPREFYVKECTAKMAKEDFKYFLDQTNPFQPKNLRERILHKIGLLPDAVLYVNHPGYEYLQKFYEQGKGQTWIQSRINYKYNIGKDKFNPQVPEISDDKYQFYLLTGLEKDLYFAKLPTFRKQGKIFKELMQDIVQDSSGQKLDSEDRDLINRIAKTTIESRAFDYLSELGGKPYSLDITTPEELYVLPKFLQKCFDLDKQV